MSNGTVPIQRLVPGILEQTRPAGKPEPAPSEGKGSFGDLLGDLIQSVNDLHGESGQMQEALLRGDPVELHQVMIKLEEAGLATDLILEIRNRLVTGFTELMRMPM
jgi:flagellar hook-basal body complex protein FliE